ncbi:MAG TPA: glycosyltransferase [Micropepsaceae bacterium]|jgi:glycosyltransferase involved in cell wall biosynthesis|nr:glycosyltransferase [Micropepsaceae bacterium]
MRLIKEIFPSVVLPVRNAGGFFGQYLEGLVEILSRNFDFYEVIVIDDASTDSTVAIIKECQKRLPNLTLFCLPKAYEQSIATIAGLDHAIGDLVIILDPRLDQPDIIVPLVNEAIKGADIVYALPRDRLSKTGLYNRMVNSFVGALAWYDKIDLPTAISSARLFSRAVLNFILKAADRHRILSLAPALSGYRYSTITYDRGFPGGTSVRRLSWRQAFVKAINLTLAVSPQPLRFVTLFALSISTITIFYSVFAVVYWYFTPDIMRGWTSLTLQISGLFFLTSLVLAVMSEYMQQILDNTGRRPLYFVSQQISSDVMMIAPKLNVIEGGAMAGADRDARGQL